MTAERVPAAVRIARDREHAPVSSPGQQPVKPPIVPARKPPPSEPANPM